MEWEGGDWTKLAQDRGKCPQFEQGNKVSVV